MNLSQEFDRLVTDLKTSQENRSKRLQDLKQEVREELTEFNQRFAELSSEMKDNLAGEVTDRREEIKSLLQQYQDDLGEIRTDIQEMHRIWMNRKTR